MAEFQEVMRQWTRRCEHCDAKENVCCYVNGYTCKAFHKMKDYTNFKSVEEEIMKWAAEHPEPVYPAWRDWLRDLYGNPQMTMTDILESPIDPEIAQRLNIVPRRKRNGENQESQCHIR